MCSTLNHKVTCPAAAVCLSARAWAAKMAELHVVCGAYMVKKKSTVERTGQTGVIKFWGPRVTPLS